MFLQRLHQYKCFEHWIHQLLHPPHCLHHLACVQYFQELLADILQNCGHQMSKRFKIHPPLMKLNLPVGNIWGSLTVKKLNQ